MSCSASITRNIPGSQGSWRNENAERDPEQGLPYRARGSLQTSGHADYLCVRPEINRKSTREFTVENVEALYENFKCRVRNELERLKGLRECNAKLYEHAKTRYVPDNAGRQAVDLFDRIKGFITYCAPKEKARRSKEFPIRELIENNDAYAKMERDWSENCSESAKTPLYRWVHIPANNKQWVEQVLYHILDFYYGKAGHRDAILQPEYWSKQEVRLANPECGRSMKPFAALIKENESSNAPPLRDPAVVALYLPYLHWERSVAVAYMNQVAKDVKCFNKSYERHADTNGRHVEELVGPFGPTDELLLRQHLRRKAPLHIRRTLDQFYHVDTSDTSERDLDQTISRYAERHNPSKLNAEDEPPVLMVDQCWIWVIGAGHKTQTTTTILTCFPTTWSHFDQPYGEGLFDPLDMRQTITKNLESKMHELITPRKFTDFMIEHFINNLLKVSGSLEASYRFIDQYNRSLALLRARHADCFKNFWKDMASPDEEKVTERLFALKEFELFQEAKDIVEEIQMIQKVQSDQEEFRKNMARIDKPSKDVMSEENFPKFPGPTQRRRRGDIDRLLAQAQDVKAEISLFLEIKQQYAAISEAQSLRSLVKNIDRLARQGDEQGGTIMIFTIITIVFLPLSTMASFFGMNTVELGSGSLSIGIVFAFLFPISFLIVAVAISWAFGIHRPLLRKMQQYKRDKGQEETRDDIQQHEGKSHRSSVSELSPAAPEEDMRNPLRDMRVDSSSEESDEESNEETRESPAASHRREP